MSAYLMTLALGLASPLASAPVATVAAAEIISDADRAGIDAALDGVYGVISGPAGQKRDWAKMRSMFTADARLNSIGSKGLTGGSLDHYI